jgi:hypothetical protein
MARCSPFLVHEEDPPVERREAPGRSPVEWRILYVFAADSFAEIHYELPEEG